MRHWQIIAFIVIALIAWTLLARIVSFVTCPFGGALYCFTEKEDRAEIENERVNTQVAQHETNVATEAIDLAGRTNSNINAANEAARRGTEDIENAIRSLPPIVSDADFADLDRIYRDAYLGVYGIDGASDDADPDPGRSRPMRSPRADAA